MSLLSVVDPGVNGTRLSFADVCSNPQIVWMLTGMDVLFAQVCSLQAGSSPATMMILLPPTGKGDGLERPQTLAVFPAVGRVEIQLDSAPNFLWPHALRYHAFAASAQSRKMLQSTLSW